MKAAGVLCSSDGIVGSTAASKVADVCEDWCNYNILRYGDWRGVVEVRDLDGKQARNVKEKRGNWNGFSLFL